MHNLQYEQSESDPNGTRHVGSERSSGAIVYGEVESKQDTYNQQKATCNGGRSKAEHSASADGKLGSPDLPQNTSYDPDLSESTVVADDSDAQHRVISETRDSVCRESMARSKRHVLTDFVKESAYYRNYML